MRYLKHWPVWAVALVLLTGGQVLAQDEFGDEEDPLDSMFNWTYGPASANVGSMAEIELPDGVRLIGPGESRRFTQLSGNVSSGTEQATILPSTGADWFLVFEFDDSGYVKDDDKDDLDADDLLDSLREQQDASNSYRRSQGLLELEILGWAVEPKYNESTNNLEWATRIRASDGTTSVNHNTRLLGRKGFMQVTLVCDPEDLEPMLPTLAELIGAYSYKSGQSYAEYRKGDKIAEYGLAALITGGAVAVAAKTGLLKHLWKIIVLGAAGIGALWKKIFGGGGGAAPTRRARPARTIQPPPPVSPPVRNLPARDDDDF